MKIAIMMACNKKDLQWLYYNLQFLVKNWKDDAPTEIIVRLNSDCSDVIKTWPIDVLKQITKVQFRYEEPWPDTYHYHMYLKMTSDQYTDADLIICVDSDVILMERADTRDLMEDGKPLIYYLDWVTADSVAEKKWREPTSRLMGMDLDRDYMVATPFTFWRSTFARTRAHIEKVTGKKFRDAVYSEQPYDYRDFLNHQMLYADYEALGLFAAKCEPDRYVVKPRPVKPWKFQLFWSHGMNEMLMLHLQQRLMA